MRNAQFAMRNRVRLKLKQQTAARHIDAYNYNLFTISYYKPFSADRSLPHLQSLPATTIANCELRIAN